MCVLVSLCMRVCVSVTKNALFKNAFFKNALEDIKWLFVCACINSQKYSKNYNSEVDVAFLFVSFLFCQLFKPFLSYLSDFVISLQCLFVFLCFLSLYRISFHFVCFLCTYRCCISWLLWAVIVALLRYVNFSSR